MRLWSLHPKYLDRQGLLALWREGLLAQAVLQGNTRGYRHHPQLQRFQEQADPVEAINTYLAGVLAESRQRGYRFDASKINQALSAASPLAVTTEQLAYEFHHLKEKLKRRSPAQYEPLAKLKAADPHPMFQVERGPIAPWEKER